MCLTKHKIMEQLFNDYKNQVPNTVLMSKYNLSNYSLIKILKAEGIYSKCNSLKYSQEKIDYIKNNYFQMSNKEIAFNLNISEDWLSQTAIKLNLLKGSGWKFNCDIEDLDFNSKEFYYFLGWIASDGNINKKLLNIKLGITDKDIIDNFKTIFINSSVYVQQYDYKKTMYNLSINSKYLCKVIFDLGITPNKSYTLKVNETILNSHFIRGFFEGDGHIRNTMNGKYKRYEAGIVTASENFCNQLVNHLSNNNINTVVAKENSFYRIRISGKENLKNFTDYIYRDCDKWYLKRKKQITDQLFSDE